LGSGHQKVEMIAHQNEAMNSNPVEHFGNIELLGEDFPNLVHRKLEPVFIYATGAYMIGIFGLNEWFSRHMLEKMQN